MWDDETREFPEGFAEGRSPKKYNYTFNDLSKLTGLTVRTLWLYARKNKFDPHDLGSVVDFVNKYRKP